MGLERRPRGIHWGPEGLDGVQSRFLLCNKGATSHLMKAFAFGVLAKQVAFASRMKRKVREGFGLGKGLGCRSG